MKTRMKVLALSSLVLALCTSGFGAMGPMDGPMKDGKMGPGEMGPGKMKGHDSSTDSKMKEDGVMMKDGQMMVMKDGHSTAMTQDSMEMKDGTKVMKDGAVTMKDGMKMNMKEGDMMTMEGKLMKSGM